MKWKKIAGNTALMLGSCAIGLLLCEVGARIIVDPVDYLSPRLVRDDVLGMKLPPHSGGHDAWGFRNKRVPQNADIVAVGDSHTYGNCARMSEAWPQVLGQITGQTVYNLGMGGYGPNQYEYLLQTRGIALKPRVVVCGLYMGDDFDNALQITYGLNYWASLRGAALPGVDADIWEKEAPAHPSLQKRFRIWLSENSVIYKLVVHGLFQDLKGRFQMKNAQRIYEGTTTLVMPEHHLQEAFRPNGVLKGLDQQQAGVREGMRLTLQILKDMNALCATNHARFVVAIIPTKESVFARYLEHNEKLAMSDRIDKVIANERLARKELFEQLGKEGIRFVDLLPALEKASENEHLYTFAVTDMHPNKNGYRVIAQEIAQCLKAADGSEAKTGVR